jgi:hypothetical protein
VYDTTYRSRSYSTAVALEVVVVLEMAGDLGWKWEEICVWIVMCDKGIVEGGRG